MIKKERYKPKIIVVCGQTGSGKTSLAVELCKKFGGEIVNADSRQVYREMDIGTAKNIDKNPKSEILNPKQITNPKFQTIQGIPVHLVNVVNPDEKYSVGRFKKEAEEAIEDIISRGKVPFIVGGTGLYIDALIENFQIPSENIQYPCLAGRQAISNIQSISNDQFSIKGKKPEFCRDEWHSPEIEGKELPELVEMLEKLDPESLKTVDLKNRRRIERALEYCLNTEKKFSQSRKKGGRKYGVLKIALKIDRETLHKKTDQRVEEMINEGLENEVKMLAEKYGWDSEAMTGIGYKEWKPLFVNSKFQMTNYKQIPNIKSQMSKNIEASVGVIDQIKQSTHNYAKRQMTWFKRDKEINWIGSTKEAEKLVADFLK